MKIGKLDTLERVAVIAEIGNNHEGDFGLAKEMIAAAADAGADIVKFQTIVPERLVSPLETERVAQLGRFRFSYEQFAELAEVAASHSVQFMSTPFDIDSLAFLDGIVPAFKIASPDNTFYPLIERAALTGKPILLSCGLCDMNEVITTTDFIKKTWADNNITSELALLHCVSSYPTPENEANIGAIAALKGLRAEVGYSDHTLGIEAAVLSVAAGARIVEKHFTIDKNHSDFRDHQLSADPEDLKEMVGRIRQAEALLGHGQKQPGECEQVGRTAFRRSAVAASDLAEGTVLTAEHIDWVRPGGGIRPDQEATLVGRPISRSIKRGEQIMPGDLEG